MGESLGGFGRCVLCGRRIGFWASIRAIGVLGGNPLLSGRCWRCRLREQGFDVASTSSGYVVTVAGVPTDHVFQDEESAWREAESAWRRATYRSH